MIKSIRINPFVFRFLSGERIQVLCKIMCVMVWTVSINPSITMGQVHKQLPFVEETSDAFIFFNAACQLFIDKKTWQIQLFDTDEKLHVAHNGEPYFFIEGNWVTTRNDGKLEAETEESALLSDYTTDGHALQFLVQNAGDYGFQIKISSPEEEILKTRCVIKLSPVEEIYGFGEVWNGHLAQRGQEIEIWDKSGTPDECAYMPYFVSTNNYVFFMNYGGFVRFDVGKRKSDELIYESTASELDITLVIGNDIASCVYHFLSIIGMPAKPPRWAFKPWFWLMGDPNKPKADIETLRGGHFIEMINKLNELDIPIGVTWFEPPWQDARSSFIPNTEFSPDLKKLIREIEDMDVRTLAWTVPYTTTEASNWKEAVELDLLVKKACGKEGHDPVKISVSGEVEGTYYNYIDYYNPQAREWWQEQIEQSLDLGLKGFKLDAAQDLPRDGVLFGGISGKDVHNSYALEYNRVFFESLQKKYNSDFLMVPRAAWVGSSVYTNFKWPGDLSTSFANNGLPSSVYSSLSLAFCGFPFVTTDIGGFSGRPPDENVWIRWAQFGSMLPGMETLNMPWWYSEKAIEHYRYLAWLHTDLSPYWETLANEAIETGAPICKPLVWNYQDDRDCWRIDDQFTVGNFLLVAPIVNHEKGRQVYLPEGRWIDFWNENKVFTGPCSVRWFKGRKEGKWKFPLYIKEGAVIPMEVSNDVTGFGSRESVGYITLAIWPEKYAKNDFVLNDLEGPVRFITDWFNRNEIKVSWDHSTKDYLFRIHLRNDQIPVKIMAGNETLKPFNSLISLQRAGTDGWFFNEEAMNIWIRKLYNKNSGALKIHLK